MKHIKAFDQLFESQQVLTQMQKDWLDECIAKMTANSIRGAWSVNPQTGLVDIDGDFWVPRKSLTDFRGVRFGRVSGFFSCSDNYLSSLEGSPREVGGDFNCAYNSLVSLEGAPQQVEGNFDCEHNDLTSLEGAPQSVGGGFYCNHNQLTSLEGAPQSVGGNFYCNNNDLISLEGAPRSVGGGFYCNHNQLTSLEGAPQRMRASFDCSHNNLTSLGGAPLSVGLYFYCSDNPVSESVLEALHKKMKSGMSWPDTVASHWRHIKSEEDRILLAPYNHTLSPEELKGYAALLRLKTRVI